MWEPGKEYHIVNQIRVIKKLLRRSLANIREREGGMILMKTINNVKYGNR